MSGKNTLPYPVRMGLPLPGPGGGVFFFWEVSIRDQGQRDGRNVPCRLGY